MYLYFSVKDFAMKKFCAYVYIIVSLLLFSGCTTKMSVQKVEKNTTANGYLYNLPMVYLRIDVKRQLTGCEVGSNIVNTTVSISEIYKADPNQWYAIDYSDMSGMLKTTDFNVTSHDNFMISTINSSIKDKSIESAKNTIEGVAKIASTFLGIGLPVVDLTEIPKARMAAKLCNDHTVQSLRDYKTAKNNKEKSDKNITKLTEDMSAQKDNKKIAGLNELIKKAKAESDKQEKIASGILPFLTDTQTIYVDIANHEKDYKPSQELLNKWFTRDGVSAHNLNGILTTYIDFSSAGEMKEACNAYQTSASYEGIVYRMPYRDRLRVYSSKECDEKTLYDGYVSIPQCGKLGVLKFKNGIGQNNSFTASFSQTGAPLAFSYSSTSQLEKASAAISETADMLKQTQLDALNHQQQLLEAQKKIIDTQKEVIQSKQKLQEAEAK